MEEKNAQAAASSYILVMLLQRLEERQPGLIKELYEGAKGDRAAIKANAPNREFIENVFDEALKTLRQADPKLP